LLSGETCARAKIDIDHIDAFPPERPCVFDQRVLELTALLIVLTCFCVDWRT
jgi:hypothetical protein